VPEPKVKTVVLESLKSGDKFKLSSGKRGQLLRAASSMSAYCRLWYTEKELAQRAEQGMTKKAYEDLILAPGALVVPVPA
jgi:hypothetical protein